MNRQMLTDVLALTGMNRAVEVKGSDPSRDDNGFATNDPVATGGLTPSRYPAVFPLVVFALLR